MPLTINVNCGGSGNGCCPAFPTLNLDVNVLIGADNYEDLIGLPLDGTDNGQTAPSGYPTYADYQAAKCNYANEYARNLRDGWDVLANLGQAAAYLSLAEMIAVITGAGATSWALGLIGAGVAATGVGSALIAGLVFLGTGVGVTAYRYFSDLLTEWDHTEIVCAIYGATDVQDARTRLQGVMNTWAVDAGIVSNTLGPEFLSWLLQWLNTFLTDRSLAGAFEVLPYTGTLPSSDCSLCQGVQPPPSEDPDLYTTLRYYFELEETGTTRTDSHAGFSAPATVPAKTLTGISGQADYFNGTTSGIGDATGRQVFPNPSDMSVCVWFYPDSLPSNLPGTIVSWGNDFDSGNRMRFSIRYHPDGVLRATVGQGDNNYGLIGAGTPTLNTWHMATLTYDATTFEWKFALDDDEWTIYQGIDACPQTVEAFSIGRQRDGLDYDRFFHGSIDEVAFWTRVLVDEDKTFLYNLGFGLSYANVIATNPAP